MNNKRSLFSAWLLCIALAFFSVGAHADTTPTLLKSFAGNVNFVGTQRSLRTGDNYSYTSASSLVSGTTTASGSAPTTASVSGIPSGSTIRAAYLYWAASGDVPDYSVNFEGNAVTADRQYTITNAASDNGVNYFSGVADVTAAVAAKGNGTYTLSGLTADNGSPWYDYQNVLAGWALLVVYENAATEKARVLNVYEGFKPFYGSNIPLTISNFQTPSSNIDGRLGHLTWEGDVTNSSSMNGYSEQLRFNSTTLYDANNPIGNQFNSVSTVRGTGAIDNASYGIDFDAYDISNYLSPGMTSATSVYSSGADLVLLSMEVISVTNVPVADLGITKVLNGGLTPGQNGSYTIRVTNNGPGDEAGPIVVRDALPGALTYVSANGTGWSCTSAPPNVTCTYAGSLANGATTPALTLTVNVSASASGTISNSATVSGTEFDNNAGNDTATASYTFVPTAYAYYMMDETAWAGGVVPDSSGLGHGGTVLGSTAPTGYPPSITAGSAVPGSPGTCGAGSVPSGTTQGIDTNIDVNANLGNAGTIAFWYSSNTAWNDGNDRMLFDASRNGGNGGADKHFYLVKRGDGSLMFAIENSSDSNSVATSPAYASFAADTWHHIAVTWNLGAGPLNIYLDGNPTPVASSSNILGGNLGNTDTLYLGARRSGSISGTSGNYTANSANGYIDEFYAFSGALTAAQIVQITNNTHYCGSAVAHYAISYPLVNPGVTCEAMAVRITAHASDHSAVAPPANTQITLSTSPAAGGWALRSGIGVFTGPNTYTFSGAENAVDFWLTQTTPTTAPHINISVTDGGKTDLEGDATEDVRAQFADTGFLFADSSGAPVSINNQIAGKDAASNGQSLFLRAVRKSDSSNACVGALQGTKPIDWAYECNDPTTCSGPNLLSLAAAETKTISPNNNGSVASYNAVNMTFDGNGYAPFNFTYGDVGKIKLYVHKTLDAGIGTPPSTAATLAAASNAFVVKPAAFELLNIKQTASTGTPNPGAVDASGLRFVKAGEDFSVTVKAVNTAGQATPNFGREIVPEGVKLTQTLYAPAGGDPGSFTGSFGPFSGGMATGTAFNWSEVGIIKLHPGVLDADYLGAGDVADTSHDQIVGRFIPDHFGLAGLVATRSDLPRTTGSIVAGSSTLNVTAATGITTGNALLVLGAGVGGTALQANVSAISGNAITLSAPASTNATATKVYNVSSQDQFTYMGEPMLLQLTVAAYRKVAAHSANPDSDITQNYAGDFAKLSAAALTANWFATGCGANVQCFGLGAINAATPLTSRLGLDTSVSSPVSAWDHGKGMFTAHISLARPTSTPPDATWGPYGTLSIGGAPQDSDGVTLPSAISADIHHVDLDADALAPNERKLIFTTASRLGRLRFASEYGSELLPLPIHVTTQYWNGTTYITNSLDNATTFGTSAVDRSNPKRNLAVNETGFAAPASVVFKNGAGLFTLAKPSGGDLKYDGSIDLSTSAFPYLPANTGRATFGVFKSGPVIYIREMY